jgi:hypothetical protein
MVVKSSSVIGHKIQTFYWTILYLYMYIVYTTGMLHAFNKKYCTVVVVLVLELNFDRHCRMKSFSRRVGEE